MDWLQSSVFFIYKGKGCRSDPGNYWSICIQDPFAKVYSSILTKHISSFAETYDLLPNFQFVFRSKRSTTSAAALLHELAYTRLKKGKRTYVAYIDFAKAFDRVRRPLLFHKLQLLGIPSQFCQSLNFIFQSTKFFIKAGDSFTHYYTSNVGVPQGDPISPILFNLFIHDLPSSLHHNGVDLHGIRVHYLQYADDLCLIGDTKEDLQRGLNDLENYCAENYIEVNTSKSKVQVFHRGRLPPCAFNLSGYLNCEWLGISRLWVLHTIVIFKPRKKNRRKSSGKVRTIVFKTANHGPSFNPCSRFIFNIYSSDIFIWPTIMAFKCL